MNWIKLIFINFFVFAFPGCFFGNWCRHRKDYIRKRISNAILSFCKDSHIDFDPCNEMRTDVLFDHSPNNPKDCIIKEGYVHGEYDTIPGEK